MAGAAIGFGVAWLVLRTDVPQRRLWTGAMFALLLAPSYLVALGWERLLEPSGVLDLLGLHPGALRTLFYGPFGVIVVLTAKGVPFAYLAISGALRGLGEEFETAVRVHGGGPLDATRVVLALLAPAIWSALAIVFAESISDFGVAATLANDAHFPVATFTLYNAVGNFPIRFPVAAAIGWILMAMAGLALLAQGRALRGRSYRVLGGRSRPARRQRLSPPQRVGALAGLGLLVLIGLGIPAIGAVSASLVRGLGSLASSHSLTFSNYRRVFHSPALRGPLAYSTRLALIAATLTTVLAAVSARMLAERASRLSARLLDLMLLTAVALPGIVFAAGYIFTYNLPLANHLGIHLYETPPCWCSATWLPSCPRRRGCCSGPSRRSSTASKRPGGCTAQDRWCRGPAPCCPYCPARYWPPGSSPSPPRCSSYRYRSCCTRPTNPRSRWASPRPWPTTTMEEARPWRSLPSCLPCWWWRPPGACSTC
ncbi:MAG: hypothetical protein DLM54_06865 [Acidimicrobiales bacterium]|nr:MAG: hypothetical protein DLM54_06865 [Acidimicrobiales bacterium]